jgi:hypothetical protein
MSNAALETKSLLGTNTFNNNSIKNCQVSVDGTWQKRGYSSMNGVVTLISRENGKCLDTAVLSKYCKGCAMWNGNKNKPGYLNWKTNHICQANHNTSSGSMEAAGAILMFSRSVKSYGLRYTSYIGDGDTSSFNEVKSSNPYGEEIIIEKLECVGHVQKRLGTRCRSLLQSMKGKVLSDGKKLNGAGRLTDKVINKLQNYYGMAIRQNKLLYPMKKSVWAVLFHNSNISNPIERHQFCPQSKNSWCLWQADKLNNQNKYKPTLNIPLSIKTVLLPTFHDLSSDELLSKCLHGQTQNNNEALNSIIWKKCPKNIFVGRKVLEIGVSSAVLQFNEGATGICKVFERLKITIGQFMMKGFLKKNNERIRNMRRKSSKKGIQQRKILRNIRKGYSDIEYESEKQPAYSIGGW